MGISGPIFGSLTLAGMACKSKERKTKTQATMAMIPWGSLPGEYSWHTPMFQAAKAKTTCRFVCAKQQSYDLLCSGEAKAACNAPPLPPHSTPIYGAKPKEAWVAMSPSSITHNFIILLSLAICCACAAVQRQSSSQLKHLYTGSV